MADFQFKKFKTKNFPIHFVILDDRYLFSQNFFIKRIFDVSFSYSCSPNRILKVCSSCFDEQLGLKISYWFFFYFLTTSVILIPLTLEFFEFSLYFGFAVRVFLPPSPILKNILFNEILVQINLTSLFLIRAFLIKF